MGKAFSKNQFNVKNNKIVNNKNYLTNADQNGISTNPDNNNNNNNAKIN